LTDQQDRPPAGGPADDRTDERPDLRDDDPSQDHPVASRPGVGTFTIEGRSAPGLFVVGWLATLLGLGMLFVGVLSGQGQIIIAAGLALLSIGLISGAGAQAIERRARGRDPYTGPSPVLVFAAAIPSALVLALVVGSVLGLAGIEAPRAAGDLLLLAIQGATYVGLVALLVVGTGALSWSEIGLRRSGGRVAGDLLWGAAFAGPVIAVTLVVTSILVAILQAAPESPLPPTGELSGLLLHLVAGAVVAPFAEEVLFRGVGTTAWVRSFGVWPGIIRSAIFFSVAHVLLVGGETLGQAAAVALVGFAGRLPVSIALGWVYVRRHSLWASIGLHGAFNGILIVLAHVAVRAGAA
jgi:membrane protease YdiL (CAAX protease family)